MLLLISIVVPSKVKIKSLSFLFLLEHFFTKEFWFFLLLSACILFVAWTLCLWILLVCIEFAESMIEPCREVICVVLHIFLLLGLLWFSSWLFFLVLSRGSNWSWCLISVLLWCCKLVLSLFICYFLISTSCLCGCFVVFSVILLLVWVISLLVLIVEMPLSSFIVV